MARLALVDVDRERRRERLELAPPVGEQRERRDDQHRTRLPSTAGREHPRDRLHRLAEAHVVRQQRAKSVVGEKLHPRHPTTLVVTETADEARRLGLRARQPRSARVSELVDEPAQPAVRAQLLDLQAADVSDSKREGERLHLPRRALLERPQRLAQDGAVDLDPAVAEIDERRTLVEQETDLLRPDRLPGDAHGELHLPARTPRGRSVDRRRTGRGDVRLRRHRRLRRQPGDAVAGRLQLARGSAHERLRPVAVERQRKLAIAAARGKSAQGRPHADRLSECAQHAARAADAADHLKGVAGRPELEDDAAARLRVQARAAAPLLELRGECGALRVVPGHQP